MNSKANIMKSKVLIPLICVFILVLLTLVISVLSSDKYISNIIDSYFPVWIFLSAIIIHSGITCYAKEEANKNITVSLFEQKFMKVSRNILLFLIIQIFMSFSSLWEVISISRISNLLMVLVLFVVIGEIVSIRRLYNSLESILYSDMDKIAYRKTNKKTYLYILLYFAIYFIFTLIVALDYYMAVIV